MKTREYIAEFVTKLPKVILLCVVLYLISLNFKAVHEASDTQKEDVEILNIIHLDDVKKYFPACTSLEKVNDVYYKVKSDNEEMGKLLVTTPIADDLIGFAGNVPLI